MLAENGRPLKQYLGARFFKSDLQMQTPFDAGHWVGEKYGTVEETAEAYIRRCYEVDLEIIALTEHNFVSKQHLPVFQQMAKKLSSEFGYELIIFPGFEFTANVGKGVHVLAVFEPGADLDQIDHILTECGVPHPRQNGAGQHENSSKSLDEIIRIVQAPTENGGKRGLVILPHIQSNSGIFDDDKIAEWLQQKEFTNSDLLAVEVPKSPNKMSKAFQKLFGNGDDCLPAWKRTRSVCCVMSSDAKTLVKNEQSGNAIGSKFTWIKMSTPSIEALRQAFLDHESRIRRSDEWPNRPELAHTHPHIESIRVGGAKFLADEEIYLSQNLTTLIGGRGTGKSTLVEYLRIALQQEAALGTDKTSQLISDLNNVRDTLGLPQSRIDVTYNKGADFKHQKLNLVVVNGAAEAIDATYGDVNTYLPIKIYSRGQIEAIANDPQKQASIIDDLILAPLEALKNDERDIIRRLRDLNESLRQEPEILTARGKLIADISNLNAQIEAIKGKSSGLEKWSKWNAERQFLIGIEGSATEHIGLLTTAISVKTFAYKDAATPGDNPDFLKQYRNDVLATIGLLHAEVEEAMEKAKNTLAALSVNEARTNWQAGFDKIDAENQATIKELAEMGISFQAYDELFRRRETAQAQLDIQDKRLVEIVSNREEFGKTYNDELLEVWKRQYELRSSMASRLNEQVTKTKVGTPTVQSKITKHGDFKSFAELMASHHKDKRVVSQTDWEAMLKAAFDIGQAEDCSPLDVIERWLKFGTGTPSDFPNEEVQPKKLTSLTEWLNEYDINELRTHRIADAVTVSLHRRDDGKQVGDLVGRKLSAGQKATTVLSLLLAEGTCPIIIDQPEDDLDNEFVFEQLVPMLVAAKEKRQIVVVTHNANVPVNGDAELIVPLEVRDSRGAQKVIKSELAVGALDRHPVQRAVELILEGSSEAFRRRREKYGV